MPQFEVRERIAKHRDHLFFSLIVKVGDMTDDQMQ